MKQKREQQLELESSSVKHEKDNEVDDDTPTFLYLASTGSKVVTQGNKNRQGKKMQN